MVRKTTKGYTISDKKYPYIGYPVYATRKEAEEHRAGIYGLTRKEYSEWRG